MALDAAAMEEQARALSSALAKLPALSAVVYRSGDFPDATIGLYLPGAVLREDAFTSASRNGGSPGRVLYEIASTGGRSVAEFAADGHEAEDEVVFDRGTCFLVLAHEVVAGRHHVLLADVPDGGSVDAAGAVERIHAVRAAATGRGAPSGLPADKQDFPIGIRPDGTPNAVDGRTGKR